MSITRSIANQAKSIRIPIHIYQLINRYLRMEERAGAGAWDEETAAKELDVSVKKVRLIKSLIQGIRSEELEVTAEALQKLQSKALTEPSATPEDMVTFQLENEELADHMQQYLSDREQQILKIRYGLDDGEPRTLAETGRVIGVSRERIRQIEKRALQKLKLMLQPGSGD